jgi:hypothetical protein
MQGRIMAGAICMALIEGLKPSMDKEKDSI